MTSWIAAIGRMLRAGPEQTAWAWSDRQSAYNLYDAYYGNHVYLPQSEGGQRENVNATLGNASAADLAGIYNPVAAVVDLYLQVFGGTFKGPNDDPATDTDDDIRAIGAAETVAALDRIYRWSNLTIEKQPLCRYAATDGLCGLRIVARDDPDPARRRVYIKPEHPRAIRDVAVDDRGNVTAIELEYDLTRGIGEAAETITVREVMTKAEIATYRVNNGILQPLDLAAWQAGENSGPNAAYPNALGVVPYVLLRHEYDGGIWGRNAFYRARVPIDRLNALLTHIAIQIHDHVRVTWMVAASGEAPVEFDFSGRKVLYVDTTRSGGTPPAIEALVAKLDLTGARQEAELQLSIIEDMLPELKATQGRYLSGQSGETIAQLRAPARDRLRLARSNYEDALIRASQIALSWGVLLDLWDLGAGSGTREAADRSYQSGAEDFTFNDRPILEGGAASTEGGLPTSASVSTPPASS